MWHPTVMGFEQAYAAAGKVKHGSYYAMQDMTSEICNNVTVPSDQSTATLVDTRDNNLYTVAKLKDGRCWMTQNLRLQNYTLNPNDSDVVGSNFTVPSSSGISGWPVETANGNRYSRVYVGDQGGFYTWYTATAGEGTTDAAYAGSTLEHSICPKSFKLPDQTEGQTLINKYDNSTIQQAPAYFITTGRIQGSSLSNTELGLYMTATGSKGAYWQSPSYGVMYHLLIRTGSGYGVSSYMPIINGNPVRCLSR